MSESAARLGPERLAAAVEAAPDGVALFAADWTICYVNPAGARLLRRDVADLVSRNIWAALPEVGGTIFHSFLLHAHTVGTPVSWQGYYAPAGRWLSATAVLVHDLLHVYFRESTDRVAEPRAAGEEPMPAGRIDERADLARLQFLAEVSEAMITTLDTGESATQLAELVVSRLCDWAVVAMLDEDGRSAGPEARAHREPARGDDLDTYLDGRRLGTGDDSPLLSALLTGEPVQLTSIDPALVEPSLSTEEVRAAWRRLNSTSCTIVPLRARSTTIGAIRFAVVSFSPAVITVSSSSRSGSLVFRAAKTPFSISGA